MFCGPANATDYARQSCAVHAAGVALHSLLVLCVVLALSCTRGQHRGNGPVVVRFPEHNSRCVLALCLLLLLLLEGGEGLAAGARLHDVVGPVAAMCGVVAAVVLYHRGAERRNSARMLGPLLLYWPLCFALRLAEVPMLYAEGLGVAHLRVETAWAAMVAYAMLAGIEITLMVTQKYLCHGSHVDEEQYKYDISNIQYLHPYVNLFSKATFSWLLPLLKLGYKRPIELADLEELPQEEKAEHQFKRFNEVFLEEKELAERNNRRISLWRCYWLTFWRTLCMGGVMKIMGDVVGLIGPLSISVILSYVSSVKHGISPSSDIPEQPYHPTSWEFLQNGFAMCFVVLVSTFLQSTLSNNFNHLVIAEGIHLKTALQCLVYKKALRINSAAGVDTGALANHMSVDAFNMMMLFSMGHYLWAVPVKIILLLVLLYVQLGYSALIGSACIFCLVPVQYYICSLLSRIQRKALAVSDDRLKKTTELLQGIKLLKLYGWEMMYANIIQKIREKELGILRNDAICVAFNTFTTQASSIVVTLVTFSLYSNFEGRPLTPTYVFTGLALFNQLTVPLYIIPFVIPMVINAVVSTERLVNFLSLPEVDLSLPWRDNSDAPAARIEFQPESGSVLLHVKEQPCDAKGIISVSDDGDGVFSAELLNLASSEENTLVTICNGYFAYSVDMEKSCLSNINLQVPIGKLTAVIGTTGSGKSSLLSAILGELHTLGGTMTWNSMPLVAYVPQKPWLMNATLKENIVFGQPYDGRRYHQVIQACALQPDIDLLPARDLTEIGERGLNLSGGQRQRIALARAFYSFSRLVILDDPFSALDAHVSAYVFEHGIKTLLLRRHRTVLLVTHKLEFLSTAAKVVVLEDGMIKAEGSFKEIEEVLTEFNLKRTAMPSKKVHDPTSQADTSKERHKLVRLLSRQTLFRATSSQDIRPRAKLVSLSRQMSHDPSSPLPCHDWGDHDDPLPAISDPDDLGTGHQLLRKMKSIESLRSRSSMSSSSLARRSWRCPPSRLNSRISTRTEDLIEEEEEEDDEEESDEKSSASKGRDPLLEGQLLQEEEREKGKISKQVYLMYMRACTLPLSCLVIFLISATQAMKIGTDFWLSSWSEVSLSHDEDEGSENKDGIIHYYISIYAVMSGVSIVLAFFTNLMAQLTSLRAVRTLHNKMLSNIVQCPMKFFDSTPVGRIINRFSSDMSTIDKKLPVTLPVLLRFILLCLSAVFVDVIVTPYFLIMVVPVAAIYYFLQHFFRFTSRELQRLDCITKSPIYSHFSETVAGLSTIRAFRAEPQFAKTLMACIDVNNSAFLLVNCANCWLGVSLDYLGGFILFVATLSAMLAAIYGQVSEAFVGMAMTYTLLVPIYLNWVVRNLASTEMYMSAVERVRSYSKLQGEVTVHKPADGLSPQWPMSGEIVFQNITLKYDTNSDPVLKNITLTIKPGEKVGICGRTGSGKSSLTMALFRMVDIMSGAIRVDGIDITDIPLETLRSRLSIIPQESVLFSGTVRENLDPGNNYSDEELWHALEVVELKKIVKAYRGGLDAQVSEEGSTLSAGQRQLFCLARALIRRSKILVTDEATSSLDSESEKVLQDVVAQYYADCTVLSIVHRVQSILSFDKVVVLDAGRIAEMGNPRELKDTRGSIFSSLLKATYQPH